ncbi:single-stranded-DNA-specific exonuclease RecJ [Roseiterribacter gracilis]|uniref:Single-stranded-DNA-specific exonuclease RecJ n=1 Tax=Roseiterribacter gracilis TaxID=2812848 RepID=A0A8S8X6R5_9PROT|nr:single-stranded-DNA-specific exonuclease RecJ [Rhodospirillales bacterium TMPK1]
MTNLAFAQTEADDALVANSATARRWIMTPVDGRTALAIAQSHDLPDIVARVLAGRGIGLDAVEAVLDPTLRRFLPDPSSLKDMDVAAARIARAVMQNERIALFADYDVDGGTSAALLTRFLRAVGVDPIVYIPDRIDEGYGPNAPALRRLAEQGAKLVITLDCGVTAHDPLDAAKAAGLDVVVIDHHQVEAQLPVAHAVVNPNRMDEDGSLGHLAAVGVTFVTIVAVNRVLRGANWYAARPEPNLMQWLDLVALGTVCDVVPLTGLNRAFVVQGLKVMARRGNVGLAALADVARAKEAPNAYHCGFLLGPRVNAGGRVGEAGLGARLLASDDTLEAAELATRLDVHNEQRRNIEQAVLDAAIADVERAPTLHQDIVLVAGEGWHPGVVGIVASRLVERYRRPAIVIGLANGVGKGSGRSVAGVDLGSAIIAARQSGLLRAGGGHRMAAGLTVEAGKLDELRAFLTTRLVMDDAARVPTVAIDATLSARGATLDLVKLLDRVGPYGAGHAEPRFAFMNAQVIRPELVGTAHVRCLLGDIAGGRLKAIAFRSAETDLGRTLLAARDTPVHVAGRLQIDRWNGEERVQLIIDDVARA